MLIIWSTSNFSPWCTALYVLRNLSATCHHACALTFENMSLLVVPGMYSSSGSYTAPPALNFSYSTGRLSLSWRRSSLISPNLAPHPAPTPIES
ncbi:hypothetical protein D3C71_1761650 [compost metagenome]